MENFYTSYKAVHANKKIKLIKKSNITTQRKHYTFSVLSPSRDNHYLTTYYKPFQTLSKSINSECAYYLQ